MYAYIMTLFSLHTHLGSSRVLPPRGPVYMILCLWSLCI